MKKFMLVLCSALLIGPSAALAGFKEEFIGSLIGAFLGAAIKTSEQNRAYEKKYGRHPGSVDRRKRQAAAKIALKKCKKDFENSAADNKANFHSCSSRGWSVAKLNSDPIKCIMINPSHQFWMSYDEQQKSDIGFGELHKAKYILSSKQEAEIRIAVDNKPVHDARSFVKVSETPPLRYGYTVENIEDISPKIAQGNKITLKIAESSWPVSLSGSAAAIKLAKKCVEERVIAYSKTLMEKERLARKHKADEKKTDKEEKSNITELDSEIKILTKNQKSNITEAHQKSQANE